MNYKAQFEKVWQNVIAETPKKITSPETALGHFAEIRNKDQEYMSVAILNGAHEVIKVHTATVGMVNRTYVQPRDIFREAIKHNAAGIIIAHNHPSGSVEPSIEDMTITKRLKECADLLQIPILDHLIISAMGFYSFLEEGKL